MDKKFKVFIEMGDTERLSYRLLNKDDFEFYYKLTSNKEAMKYAFIDRHESIEEARKRFDKIIAWQGNDEQGTQFVVIHKETKELIGIVDYTIELLHPNGGVYEISYLILPNYWGFGYAIEMSKSIIDYLFDNYNLHKISASCHIDNKASEGIMKKLLMIQEGVFRKARYKDRKWSDEIRYGLLKDEWFKKKDCL